MKTAIPSRWAIMISMAAHAGYLLSRYLVGTDGRTPVGRLRGKETKQAIVEFGEQVWARPQRTKNWQKKADLAARWVEATWVGIFPKTGEHLVILAEGGAIDESQIR